MRRPARRAARGFTLIEAVIVIVIIGVIGAIVGVFIRMPIQGYADSVARAEVTDEADLALRRIARDLRLALPNSIRVNADGSAIEFLLTKTGGRYLSAEDGMGGEVLDFIDPAKLTFTVVGPMPGLARAVAGDFVVVNNLGEGMRPSDAYGLTSVDRNIARIASVDAAAGRITLADNPFAQQSTPMPSPTQRFQVISGAVSYRCAAASDGTLVLTRHWGYAITTQQNAPPVGPGSAAPLASRLANCRLFEVDSAAARRSALVLLTLALKARNESDPIIQLVHQVHVDNTP
ncbi:MAG TPA: prepilin-type N-terminal cleavage/methylation domain-containing protein [Telluria sp.]